MPDGDPQQREFRIDDGGPSYPYEKMRQAGRGRPPMRKVSGQAGRVPPQATDVEQSVLGAMLIEREAIPQVIEILPPEAFYERRHGQVYQAIRALFDRSNPVDLITLTEELKRRSELEDVGGSPYLTELTTAVASAANVEHHARIIAEKSLLRKMIDSLTNLVGEAYEPGADAFDLLDQAEEEIFGISDSQLRSSSSEISDVVKNTVEKLQDIHGQEGGITGVPSGFGRLDDLTSGWQDSDLIIVAARPSMGKCLGRGTPVMMHDGTTKPVEEVEVGDRLMGDDSEPRTVQSLARGRERMYWVRQTYGMDYRVNESHILTLKKNRREGAEPRGAVTDLSVREYFGKSEKWRDDHKGFKVAVEFPEQPLPLDPYVLGLWLGDGGVQVCGGAGVRERSPVAAMSSPAGNHPSNLQSVNPSQPRSGEHVPDHIPQRYLANARANRLKLLAGLIDCGGHLNDGYGGTYEITQTNRRLARQIKLLCDTLGYRTSIGEKTARVASTGHQTTAHRVRFSGDVGEIPVRVARKQASAWAGPEMARRDGRVSGVTVEPDGAGDYYGFTLDGNGRFLLADGTVTHNTAFCLASAMNAALHPRRDTGVAIFSLEMGAEQLAQRLLTSEARVDAQRARTGRMDDEDWRRLARAAGTLSDADIFIDDTPGLSILELRAKCRRLVAEHDVGLVVVDYLQLMHGTADANNREQEIAQISRSLKSLAKELDLPVIALSQLNRGVENRGGDKRPQLSDLRESGSIEQDADVVAFIYRAERYGITVDAEGNSTEGIAEIIIGKQRNGPVGTVELAFVKQYARFENLSSYGGGSGYGGDGAGSGDVSAEDFQDFDEGGESGFSAPQPSGDAPF